MIQTTGFGLVWLELTGQGKEPARIEFRPGLNVIWGASNTGKTFILTCIDYLLGSTEPPKKIPEMKGYTTGRLGILDRTEHRRVLERSLQGGDFTVFDADADWGTSNPQELRAKHDPNRTDTLSHLLLSILGIAKKKILSNKAGKTRDISFRDIAARALIHEQRIIDPRTPVYPSGQYTRKTEELSAFSFLISGDDFSSIVFTPDIKIEKASWKGKEEVLEQLLADLRQEIGENPPSLQTLAGEIADCDVHIADVTASIEQSSRNVAEEMKRRRVAWEAVQRARSRLLVISQLQERFALLRSHYHSDLERMTFITEGDFYLAQLGAPSCPYCGGELDDHTLARLQEARKGC